MPTDIDRIQNHLERRATMIVEMLSEKAQRIVDSMDEPPPGTQEPDAATVRLMWNFTAYGSRAAQMFWGLHDLALEKMMGEMQAQPMSAADRVKAIRQVHQKAEMAAMQKIYPHRASLLMLGITTPERSVQLAERAKRLAEQDQSAPEMAPSMEGAAYG
jgi:hypothetical protein